MGLAFQSISRNNAPTFFDNMASQGLITAKKFSFWLNGDLAQSNGGQLFFGGSNPAYYTGTMTYVPLSSQTYWQFAMNRFVHFETNTIWVFFPLISV
jgi:cathepsin D